LISVHSKVDAGSSTCSQITSGVDFDSKAAVLFLTSHTTTDVPQAIHTEPAIESGSNTCSRLTSGVVYDTPAAVLPPVSSVRPCTVIVDTPSEYECSVFRDSGECSFCDTHKLFIHDPKLRSLAIECNPSKICKYVNTCISVMKAGRNDAISVPWSQVRRLLESAVDSFHNMDDIPEALLACFADVDAACDSEIAEFEEEEEEEEGAGNLVGPHVWGR
jgi:hypothetical protein